MYIPMLASLELGLERLSARAVLSVNCESDFAYSGCFCKRIVAHILECSRKFFEAQNSFIFHSHHY